MKKYIAVCLWLFCLLFSFDAVGKTEKMEEFSLNPAPYLHFWENNLKNYWRYASEEREKKIDPQLSVVIDEFHFYIGMLEESLKLSGLYDIEEISAESVRRINDDGSICFRNNISIEYDDETQGFLKALFSELPEEKIPPLSEKEEDLKDIYLIKKNTLLLYDIPLNFNAVMQTPFKDSRLCGKIDSFSRKYFKMTAAELADSLSGVWGGIINIKKYTEGKNAGRFMLDFSFVLPDPDKKIFKSLGEYLVVNKKAFFKDNILIWHTSSLLKNMFIMSSDNFLIITSSPDDLAKLGETAEKKEIDDVLKKINVPSDADEKSFVYWNREFSAFVNLLLLNRPYTFKFMKDFSGSDVFCTFDFDDDEIEIKQYASLPVSQIFLMPFALNMMAYYDTFVFRQGRRKYIAGKKELQRKKCLDEMKEYASKLKTYREKSGKYPEGVNAEGLKNFALFAGVPAERFTLHITKDRAVPFARYYYWGENSFSTRKDLPLFCDRGSAHPDKIHVIFCDGSVREFELENVRSAKRIASFLHTVFKYDNETFVMLLKQAEKLDSEKL